MPKLYYSANGKVIENMTQVSDSLNLTGNLEIAGTIKAGSYQNMKGEPLSFVNPKGELTVGGITSKNNKIGINQKFPETDLHVGHSLYVGKDTTWSTRISDESLEQGKSEMQGKGFLTTPWLNASHIEAINKTGEIHFYGANGKAISINKKVENSDDPIVSVPGVFQANTIRANKYMLGDKTLYDVVSNEAKEVAKKTTESTISSKDLITSASEIAIKRNDKFEARLHRPLDKKNPNTYLDYVGALNLRKDGQTTVEVDGNAVKSNIFEITGNIPHPDRGDGMIYRADGQVQISTDDFIRLRHVGSKETGIQLDTSPGTGDMRTSNAAGDMRNPNGQMKITRQGIMFGGPNTKGYQVNSAQISAGQHIKDSLNIVGMGTKAQNRRLDVWAEGGMNIYGKLNATSGINSQIDNRRERLTPKQYRQKGVGKYTEFKEDYDGIPNYVVVETIVPWPDTSGGAIKQIIYADYGVIYRTGAKDDSKWKEFQAFKF